MNKMVRITLILTTASLFVGLWFLLAPAVAAQSRLIGMAMAPTAQPASGCALRDVPLILVGTDGEVPLFITPNGERHRVGAATGTLVRVVDCMVVAGKGWYLVELPTRAKVWVEASALRRPAAPPAVPGAGQKVELSQFSLCEGTQVGPVRCGLELAREAETFWLGYTYSGLLPNDMVQYQIEINGEVYQSRPKPWTGPETGRHLVSLSDIPAPRVAGTWLVQVAVNGKFAGAVSVRVR